MFLLKTRNFIYLFNLLILLFIILVWVFATREVDSANWRRDIKLVEYLATFIAEYAKSAPLINELVRV